MEDIFNAEWVSDPKLVYQTINIMCKSIMDTSLKQRPFLIGISTTTFCYQHVLTYKRNYDYAWEVINGTSMGYYTGVEIPPYQMDGWQYSVIHMVLASIPSKNIKMELERSEDEGAVAKFQDGTNNYNKWDPPQNGGRGNSGPRVLFWGCGADTPMHVHLINFLGGKITFIDNSPDFIKICKEWYHDIRLIEPTGTKSNHTQVIKQLVKQDGTSLETDDVNDPLTDSQWIHNLSNVESEEPWDVIVIDGPAENLGRSQPLYMAKRLAQSYGPNHYTHIFLHDAARYDNCIVANAIMGHNPAVYMGNTLPRKGLKHWRVPGRNRPLPPSTKQ